MMESRVDKLLYGAITLEQPLRGYRVNMDSILLGAFTKLRKDDRVLELGCGSGAILLVLGWRYNRAHSMKGIEIQEDISALARKNIEKNRMSESISITTGDLRDIAAERSRGDYSVVVATPPYYEKHRSRPSPLEQDAVSRHGAACTLEDILQSASWSLARKGRFYTVFPARRMGELLGGLLEVHLQPKRIRMVHAHPQAEASVVLVESHKEGGVGMTVESPLWIRDGRGAFHPEYLLAYTKGGWSCL